MIRDGSRLRDRVLVGTAACVLATLAPTSGSGAALRCGDAALKQAEKLLRFHVGVDDGASVNVEQASLRQMAPARAPVGQARYYVLQLWGNVYKARYRMRLLYMQGVDCALIGQEILEDKTH